ncbi:MAG: hypothetical protein D6722_04815, partial [Bacteroidetes bacterium]
MKNVCSHPVFRAILCSLLVFSGPALRAQLFRNFDNSAVPDNACGSNELEIPTEVSGVGKLNLAEDKGVVVIFNMTYTYVGDIKISLESPAGTRVLLFNRHGGGGDNFQVTYFAYWDNLDPISAGTAPFYYYFNPDESLTAFDGEIAEGTWKVIVCDAASGDVGTMGTVSLVFNNTGYFK